MSSVAALPPPPPGDEDLATLYHQVLAGFAEESPTSPTSGNPMHSSPGEDVDSFYSHYTNNGDDTPTSPVRNATSARSAAPRAPLLGTPYFSPSTTQDERSSITAYTSEALAADTWSIVASLVTTHLSATTATRNESLDDAGTASVCGG
ncbi:hypothetical protein OBBRIDRAFT_231944 [Obba rivulosa]|uniref:Uncharacterized protein n=1 Tax=Obba rivulosa TaxID=1052685 RepID=A0A8E2DUX5_9APHY|nr:hypothetical protein OBBRIDRAFT_231944 [Obba rivulosa]